MTEHGDRGGGIPPGRSGGSGTSGAGTDVPRRRSYSRLAFVGRLAERAVRGYLEDACPQVAASISYRVIFAMFPLAIVLTALSGIVLRSVGEQGAAVDAIVSNLPLSADGQAEMRSLLEGATGTRSSLGLFGLIALFWAASGLMGAIRYALNRAWDVSQTRPYLQGKVFDLGFVFIAFLLVVVSLGLSIGTSVAEGYATDVVESAGFDARLVTWLLGRFTPFLLAFGAVLAAYRLLPATVPRLRHVVPSALGVAFLLTVLQALFGLYLTYVRDFNAVYGSIGAIIAFLYFTYLAANVFLLGAEVAAEIPRTHEELAQQEAEDDDDGNVPFGRQVWGAIRGLAVRDDASLPVEDEDRRAA